MTTPSDAYDIVYCFMPRSCPACDLVVDYDLARISHLPAAERRCCELAEIEGRGLRIFLNVVPYSPMIQLRYDLASAAQLIGSQGSLMVAVHVKKSARQIDRTLKDMFSSVLKIKGSPASFLCQSPKEGFVAERGLREIEYTDAHSGRTLSLVSRPGMFASESVDEGTDLLLRTVGGMEGLAVLDMCCGYGTIGATAAARGAKVTMLDCDCRAIQCARSGLEKCDLNGDVLLGDGAGDLPPNSFDLVLSNPPTHVGSENLKQLFVQMLRATRRSGSVVIVVREHLNYEKWLHEIGCVKRRAVDKGYKIIEITPPKIARSLTDGERTTGKCPPYCESPRHAETDQAPDREFLAPYFSFGPRRDGCNVMVRNELDGRETEMASDCLQSALRTISSGMSGEGETMAALRDIDLLFPNEEACKKSYAAAGRARMSATPRIEQIELTNVCPYACRMCPRPRRMTRKTGYMDLGLFREICRQIAPFQRFVSLHHFGESLLHPQLPEAVAIAREHGLNTGLSCNAPSMDLPLAQRLQDSGLSSITFNLDSMNNDCYQKIRGTSHTVEENIRAIAAFLESNARLDEPTLVSVQMIGMRENKEDESDFMKTARDMGVDRALVVKFGQWDFSDAEAEQMADLEDRSLCHPPCPARWESLCVLWDGVVVPCCRDYDGDLPLGNLADTSLMEVWQGEPLDRLRADESAFAKCQRCWASWPYRVAKRNAVGYVAFHEQSAQRGTSLEWLRPGAGERYQSIGFPVAFRVARTAEGGGRC